MTREEAIHFANCLKNNWTINFADMEEFCDMAIESLSKPNYESDTEVRLAVTDRKKEKVILWDAFGEVEYYPHGDMYCPNCGVRLVPEGEYLEPTQTHGRLIDADALKEYFFRPYSNEESYSNIDIAKIIDNATTVQADRPHGEWVEVVERTEQYDREGVKTWATLYQCSNCGFILNAIEGHIGQYHFCPNCGCVMDMRGAKK